MKENTIFDVVIIGGGPAGSAAALTLLNQTSLNVGVIESTNYENIRVGESVSPDILSLLRYLRIENEFLKSSHIPAYGIDAAWGSSKILSRDFLFTGIGNGWSLDRKMFDSMMSKAIEKRNGSLFTQTKFIKHSKDGKNWHLFLQCNGVKTNVDATFVIDATGRSGSFARQLGTKWNVIDNLVGIAAIYDVKMTDIRHNTLVESIPYGWWYTTQIPNNRRIVVLMTDSDIAKDIQIQKPNNWNTELSKTNHVKKSIEDGQLTILPRIYPAYSQVVHKDNIQNWVPTGDTSSSFDPLSSMGIGHAILSGIQAARVAHNTLTSDGKLLSNYLEDTIQIFSKYIRNRKRRYSYERRWKNEPFWKRRHVSISVNDSIR